MRNTLFRSLSVAGGPSLSYPVPMRRSAGMLVGLLAASCTLAPENNFDAGFGNPSEGTDGAVAGATGPQSDPIPQGTGGASSGEQTSGDSGGFTTTPGAETSATGDADPTGASATGDPSASTGDADPTGDGDMCPANVLDDATSGTTLGQPNAASGSCGGDEAPDLAFEFTAAQDGNYTFSTDGSDFDTVLYVLDGENCGGPELACDDDGGESTQSEVTVTLSEGQGVVVVVDGYGSASGAFTLSTSAQTADGCDPNNLAGALPLTDGGPTSGNSSEEGSCGGGGAPELSFGWTAPQAGTYTIHTTGSDFDTVLYVRDGSCLGEELGCDDDGGPSTQSSLTLNLAAGQDIVIVADGYSANSGTVALTIES